jgi:hypothetical protein
MVWYNATSLLPPPESVVVTLLLKSHSATEVLVFRHLISQFFLTPNLSFTTFHSEFFTLQNWSNIFSHKICCNFLALLHCLLHSFIYLECPGFFSPLTKVELSKEISLKWSNPQWFVFLPWTLIEFIISNTNWSNY